MPYVTRRWNLHRYANPTKIGRCSTARLASPALLLLPTESLLPRPRDCHVPHRRKSGLARLTIGAAKNWNSATRCFAPPIPKFSRISIPSMSISANLAIDGKRMERTDNESAPDRKLADTHATESAAARSRMLRSIPETRSIPSIARLRSISLRKMSMA